MESTKRNKLDRAIDALALLGDGIRRKMYFLIRDARRPLSREEVAREMGISVKLAAFHLERMTRNGLLSAHYARPPGRSGPGAGRTARYYQPGKQEMEVSLPERRYERMAEMLAEAVKKSGDRAVRAAAEIAREKGRGAGRGVRRISKNPSSRAAVLRGAKKVLSEEGFEPYVTAPGEMRLKNCPFHALSAEAPEVVCRMNHEYIGGLVDELGGGGIEVILDPQPGECCVRLKARA